MQIISSISSSVYQVGKKVKDTVTAVAQTASKVASTALRSIPETAIKVAVGVAGFATGAAAAYATGYVVGIGVTHAAETFGKQPAPPASLDNSPSALVQNPIAALPGRSDKSFTRYVPPATVFLRPTMGALTSPVGGVRIEPAEKSSAQYVVLSEKSSSRPMSPVQKAPAQQNDPTQPVQAPVVASVPNPTPPAPSTPPSQGSTSSAPPAPPSQGSTSSAPSTPPSQGSTSSAPPAPLSQGPTPSSTQASGYADAATVAGIMGAFVVGAEAVDRIFAKPYPTYTSASPMSFEAVKKPSECTTTALVVPNAMNALQFLEEQRRVQREAQQLLDQCNQPSLLLTDESLPAEAFEESIPYLSDKEIDTIVRGLKKHRSDAVRARYLSARFPDKVGDAEFMRAVREYARILGSGKNVADTLSKIRR